MTRHHVVRASALSALLVLTAGLWIATSKPATAAEDAPAKSNGTAAAKSPADPRDWPFWRGPEGNSISRETGLPAKWNPKGGAGSNLKWKQPEAAGRSTPIVMRGKLYTTVRAEPDTPREGEQVICVDAETGKILWTNRFNVWSSDVPDTRVGWSSVVGDPATGRIYALGVCGYFLCIDGETGKTLWSRALHDEFGFLSTYGGRTNFPVICDDLVIISAVFIGWGEMARPAHRFLGFDKMTGEVRWYNGTRPLPEDTTFSTPAVTVLNGQKALVFGSGDGALWAFQPRTGKSIWQFRMSKRGMDASPVVLGDTVFMTHSEENIVGATMGGVFSINGNGKGDITTNGLNWRVEEFTASKASPLLVDGRLYCIDDSAKLQVFDAETGDKIGREVSLGTMGRASPLYADGKIYALENNGRWFILAPDEKAGVKILSRGRLANEEECLASPICSHGKVYILTTAALYCLEDESQEHGITPAPEVPQEHPVSDDPKPAQVQVVPAEVLMRPGETQTFKVRLFNSQGQLLKESPATFTVKGPGKIGDSGEFEAPADAAHAAAYVTAKVGDLSGLARIRIVPPLPWKFDFENLDDAPITWVGARYRHVVRKVDGNKVMVKVTTIPKGTRSRCWFGQFDLHDYTIEGDVRGSAVGGKLPDIGLIAQGYTFDMQGVSQKLQIRLWDPQLNRLDKTIDFAWKPDTWYRMKFRVATDNGKATLQGKVWPRDEDEPSAWTIETVDEFANLAGSPGLFGNATNAEIFLDNIEVYENQ